LSPAASLPVTVTPSKPLLVACETSDGGSERAALAAGEEVHTSAVWRRLLRILLSAGDRRRAFSERSLGMNIREDARSTRYDNQAGRPLAFVSRYPLRPRSRRRRPW